MEQVVEFLKYLWETKSDIATLTGQHLWLSLMGVLIGTLTAVPLGILISRRPKLSAFVIDLAGALYTIPSLAMLGFLLPFLGLGWLPTIVALVIYSWLPVLRNTCAGLAGVDPAVKEAAIGMGSTPYQLLLKVELPLAFPVIMASIRTIAVLTVGIATFGALVGGGGLGELIFTGISMMDNRMILAGTIPIAVMAVLFDQVLGYVERRLRKKVGLTDQL
ncbi:MAG: ABC transporter permease [Thermacetogeniaceae bacterium]